MLFICAMIAIFSGANSGKVHRVQGIGSVTDPLSDLIL